MKKGFTLTEMLLTVSILALVVAFGITNFSRSEFRATVLSQYKQCQSIYPANQLYFARNGAFLPTDPSGDPATSINYLNNNLNLNLISVKGFTNSLYSRPSTDAFSIVFTGDNVTITCSEGATPASCAGLNSTYCP